MNGWMAFLRLACAGAFLAAGPALAQTGGPAVIYANGNFKGYSMTLTGPLQGLETAFTAKSIKIPEGQAWEFCSGRTFSGCRRVDSSVKAGVYSIRSARPIAPVIRATVDAPDQSIKGVTSEYFVAPRQGNNRVGIAANNPEDMRRAADSFCRSAGWRRSVHAQLQEVAGTYYLIDVLCSNFDG